MSKFFANYKALNKCKERYVDNKKGRKGTGTTHKLLRA